ncbi:Uncharacterised protein [Klebsiella michiganensis]|uniref:Uncharacterized protein n=1 Tax=Klebsiella michiganensis TaxID=1134687 RepID=A0ABR5G8X3_9ENTR|nr:hypothetical protein L387_00776 [Klebsiella michiganensis]KLY28223.1 hypothetical protein SK91_04834 [Klebsiella michiganensis]OUG45129.1 hypothetical protein AZ036_000879 [Klebsiella michiganensis]STU88669.1 Uncharacterised protein [Klebsiella michiganensis]
MYILARTAIRAFFFAGKNEIWRTYINIRRYNGATFSPR